MSGQDKAKVSGAGPGVSGDIGVVMTHCWNSMGLSTTIVRDEPTSSPRTPATPKSSLKPPGVWEPPPQPCVTP